MIYIHSTITHKDYKLNLWQQQGEFTRNTIAFTFSSNRAFLIALEILS